MKNRVAVFRLYNGDFLSRTGGRTHGRVEAVQFFYDDALRFWRQLGRIGWDDPLHGMSLEVLPKRKRHHPLSAEAAQEFGVTIQTVRLLAKAEAYDRMAEGYLIQARSSESMSAKMREKAQELRASLVKNNT